MEHTKTPWKVENDCEIKESGGLYVATAHHSRFINSEEQKANARRIVAAVNATAGITTEELEFAIEENIRLDFTGRAKRINKMEAEVPAINARLLEALKDLVSGTDPYFAEIHGFSEQHDAARAAIAEAETTSAHPSQPAQVIANLTRKLGDAIKALREIEKGEGAYNRDPLQNAENVIDNMKGIAAEALKPYEPYGSAFPSLINRIAPNVDGEGNVYNEPDGPDLIDLSGQTPEQMEATLKAAVPDAIAQMQWFFDKHPDDPDPCDLARDYNDAVTDAGQPTPYDP